MKVFWTDVAAEHLDAIYEYICRDSVTYAQGVVDRLTRAAERAAERPELGRKVPEVNLPQIREILEGQYRIVYHIKSDQIDVIAVIHGAQQTPWSVPLPTQ